jgi:hypothetical protein
VLQDLFTKLFLPKNKLEKKHILCVLQMVHLSRKCLTLKAFLWYDCILLSNKKTQEVTSKYLKMSNLRVGARAFNKMKNN